MVVDPKKLESQLTEAIELAQELPEDAKPILIWDKFYQKISQLPRWQQLLISGEALNQLAEVTRLKSDCYFGSSLSEDGDVENLSEDEGVTLDDDWLDGLIRKTSSLDLSRFEKPDTRFRLPGEELLGEDLMVNTVLEVEEISDSSETLEQVIAIAHAESVTDWQDAIFSVLKQESHPIDFWVLKGKTNLSASALFLGLLLGSERWYLQQAVSLVEDNGYGSIFVSLNQF